MAPLSFEESLYSFELLRYFHHVQDGFCIASSGRLGRDAIKVLKGDYLAFEPHKVARRSVITGWGV